jgi:proline dehydrogenase
MKASQLNFSDSMRAYQSKSFIELIRSYVVFSLCQIPFLVKQSESLIKLSYKTLGHSITNYGLRMTMFGHFCAGEDEVTIHPTVKYLEKNGIGSILDYAAESDVVNPTEAATPLTAASKENVVQCRVYDYRSEEICDLHKKTFEKCIIAVKNVSPRGFAAVKVTALGNPELLKRASTALVEVRKLFEKFDEKKTGLITREQFAEAYDKFFIGGDVTKVFNSIDADGDGLIDYAEWTNGLKLEELHLLTSYCRTVGPLASSVLNEEEITLMLNMKQRIDELASLAQSLGVRLMIDAEHTYFQPVIDNITQNLMKKYNKDFPAIFGTYQLYLQDARYRLQVDMERAKRGNYKFAAKLVRGAYMVLERAHAKEHGLPDPIFGTMEQTHLSYNEAVQEFIQTIAKGHKFEVMIATHNQRSVELAVEAMNKYKLQPSDGIYFGQVSFSLHPLNSSPQLTCDYWFFSSS